MNFISAVFLYPVVLMFSFHSHIKVVEWLKYYRLSKVSKWLKVTSFPSYVLSSSYEILYSEYMEVFACSNIVASVASLFLIEAWSLNFITLDFS
jgi:hypothetical protein